MMKEKLDTFYEERYARRLDSLNAYITEAILLENEPALSCLNNELFEMLERIEKSTGPGV